MKQSFEIQNKRMKLTNLIPTVSSIKCYNSILIVHEFMYSSSYMAHLSSQITAVLPSRSETAAQSETHLHLETINEISSLNHSPVHTGRSVINLMERTIYLKKPIWEQN